MADGVCKGIPLGFWALPSTFVTSVFDPRNPSMKKGCDGERKTNRKKEEKKVVTFIVASNVVACQLPERQPTGTPIARATMKKNILSGD